MIHLPPDILLRILQDISVADTIKLVHLSRHYRDVVLDTLQRDYESSLVQNKQFAVLSKLLWLKLKLDDPKSANCELLSNVSQIQHLEVLLETSESFLARKELPDVVQSINNVNLPNLKSLQISVDEVLEPTNTHLELTEQLSESLAESPAQSQLNKVTRVYQLFKFWNLTTLDLHHLEINYTARQSHDNSIRLMVLINLLGQINWEVCKVQINLHLHQIEDSDWTNINLLKELPLTLNLNVSILEPPKTPESNLNLIYNKYSYLQTPY